MHWNRIRNIKKATVFFLRSDSLNKFSLIGKFRTHYSLLLNPYIQGLATVKIPEKSFL